MRFASDITDEDAVKEIYSAVIQRFGRIDVLVNNAADGDMDGIDTIEKITKDVIDDTFAVNVRGSIMMTREFIRHRGDYGRVINFSTDASQVFAGQIAYGSTATIVPLVIAAAPYVARMIESSLLEVDAGVIEAAQSMGASIPTIIFKVLIPEAKTSLIVGATISSGTILGYSAMSGAIGGGGLGQIAISYGYNRYQTDILFATVILLIILMQLFQIVGMYISRKTDKRVRE